MTKLEYAESLLNPVPAPNHWPFDTVLPSDILQLLIAGLDSSSKAAEALNETYEN